MMEWEKDIIFATISQSSGGGVASALNHAMRDGDKAYVQTIVVMADRQYGMIILEFTYVRSAELPAEPINDMLVRHQYPAYEDPMTCVNYVSTTANCETYQQTYQDNGCCNNPVASA